MIESNDELISRKIAESLDFILDPTREPIKRKNNIPVSIKKKIQSSHGKICPLCRIKMVHTPDKGPGKQKENEASWEHVLDLSLGGENGLENAAVICDSCNSANNSVMLEYLGQFGESFGGLKWKENFNKDRRNLVRLHRFLEWKINSILLSRVDSNLELNEIWSRFRWGETIRLLDTPRRKTNRRGILNSLFNRIISLFRPSTQTEIAQPSTQTEIAQPSTQTEIAQSSNQKIPNTKAFDEFMAEIIGNERISSHTLSARIIAHQTENEWGETGKKAVFRKFELSLNQTYKDAIEKNPSASVEVSGNHPAYEFALKNNKKKEPTRNKKMQKRQEEIKIQAKREAVEIIERITGRKSPSTPIMPDEPTAQPDNQEMRWTDLDKASLDDLGKLLVHLIGEDRMIMSTLGSEIVKFQKRNGLSGAGSKDLLKEFGINTTNTRTLKATILENFSDFIDVDPVSGTPCYYSVVGKQVL